MIRKLLDKHKAKSVQQQEERQMSACVHGVLQDIKLSYSDIVNFELYHTVNVGVGYTNDGLPNEMPLTVFVGANEFYHGRSDKMSFSGVQWSSVVEFMVSAYHECRHAEQFENMSRGIGLDVTYMSLNHLSKHGNERYYAHNYRKFVTEIDAERFGINCAGKQLSDCLGDTKAEQLMLEYVNNKVKTGVYFIEPSLDRPVYDNIDVVLDAFDSAYEMAKHAPRDYVVKKCRDAAHNFLYEDLTDGARNNFFSEQDGVRQDAMISAVVLHRHPEYKGWHKSLQDMDLSMETMFGKDWQRSDKPKQPRRLPDIPVDTYDPSGQYEP